jgi:hypothetical protein
VLRLHLDHFHVEYPMNRSLVSEAADSRASASLCGRVGREDRVRVRAEPLATSAANAAASASRVRRHGRADLVLVPAGEQRHVVLAAA